MGSIRRAKNAIIEEVFPDKYRAEIFSYPINFIKNGVYVPINLDFIDFEVDQNFILKLAGRSSSPSLITFGFPFNLIVLDLVGKKNVSVISGLNTNEAIYPNILTNIDLHVFSGGHLASIELHGDLQNRSIEFSITPFGADYEILNDRIAFKNSDGKILFNFALNFDTWTSGKEEESIKVPASASVTGGKIGISFTTPDVVGLNRLR